MKIAINGFGRIGRLVFQSLVNQNLLGKDTFDVVAVADLSTDAKYFAYQLKYDSVQGKMQADIKTNGDDTLVINGHKIKCVSGKGLTPAQLPLSNVRAYIRMKRPTIISQPVQKKLSSVRRAKAPTRKNRLKPLLWV